MAHPTLPLEKMTVAEKLTVIEEVWASLRGEEDRFDSPIWHRDVLFARKKLHAEGKTKFSNWAEAQDRIRRKVRGR